jgi:hypothetical protein
MGAKASCCCSAADEFICFAVSTIVALVANKAPQRTIKITIKKDELVLDIVLYPVAASLNLWGS